MPTMKRGLPLVGSDREVLQGAKESGKLDPTERVRVTMIVQNRSSDEARLAIDRLGRQTPKKRAYITQDEFVRRYGASREDLAKVEAFARDNALDITEVSQAKRLVVLSGTVAQVGKAFKVELRRYRHPRGSIEGAPGRYTSPLNSPL